MTTSYLGIDPGALGGFALITADHAGNPYLVLESMPKTPGGVWKSLRLLTQMGQEEGPLLAAVERVGGYTKRKGGQPGSRMFTFGRGVGHLEMALIALGVGPEVPMPRTWQAALGVSPREKHETDSAWKNRLKSVCRSTHPKAVVTLQTSDALLIATWLQRMHERRQRDSKGSGRAS